MSCGNAGQDGNEGASDTLVVATLNSLPVLGKEPISPRAASLAEDPPTVSFKLKKDDVTRFRQALKSRNMVRAQSSVPDMRWFDDTLYRHI